MGAILDLMVAFNAKREKWLFRLLIFVEAQNFIFKTDFHKATAARWKNHNNQVNWRANGINMHIYIRTHLRIRANNMHVFMVKCS